MKITDTKTWEQRFDEDEDFKPLFFGEMKSLYYTRNKMKEFIRQELSLAKQQWIEESVEEIGKMKKDYKDKLSKMEELPTVGQTLDNVLSYLKGGER